MNIAIVTYCIGVGGFFTYNIPADLEELRQNYPTATKDAEVCQSIIEKLDAGQPDSELSKAYYGAYYMLWAKHLSNPLKKLNNFKKGKKYMEEAIREAPDNPEIHFLRLTIQYHAPDMLGYKDNIQEDVVIIKEQWDKIPTATLKALIENFLTAREL